ncbi:MAG: hypothetical protein ACHQ17_04580 [Polyangia bacterium]|jgi:hypothetical protein
MRRLAMILVCAAVGCSQPAATTPTQPQAETVSPKDSPLPYKVLDDETNQAANTVEFHVLIAAQPKHDDVDHLLKYLYRHLMQRRDDAPAGFFAYVYTDESQYKTPPRSPIASAIQKPGDVGPTWDNKVPLEFWQQVDQALEHHDKGWKLEKKIVRDDAAKTLTITVPYTEPGKDQYADKLSFNMAMNIFTDTAQALFNKVPELSAMTYVGTWNNEDVVKISLDRATYQKLNLADIDEQIGQLHGRAFLELATGKSSDAKAAKENASRLAGVYKKMLAGLKGHETVSPKLK